MPSLPVTRHGRLKRADGAEIAWEATGAGPALVFAHGLGGNHMSWWRQIPAFAGRHACIAFSHRGFAPSTTPGGLPDPQAYAGDALALLDALDIDRAVLVGQSMGGWTGVELALAHPGRLAGLVLACTTGSLAFDGYGDADVAAWRARAPAAVAELTAAGIHRATGKVFAQTEPALHGLYCAIDRLNADLDKEEVGNRIRAMRTRGLADAARIACPVLCITGEDDVVIAPAGVRLVARAMPDARVVTLPATGHSAYFERAGQFNEVLRRFLDEIGWG
jgi:3-oxoadipate enol-lactonase